VLVKLALNPNKNDVSFAFASVFDGQHQTFAADRKEVKRRRWREKKGHSKKGNCSSCIVQSFFLTFISVLAFQSFHIETIFLNFKGAQSRYFELF